MELQPSYYSIIPASVRYDKELKPNEKLLYGEITALAQAQGYCWASNSYFAELYDVSKETVSRWISKLDKKGYVRTKVLYVENSKQIDKRFIYISDTPIDNKVNTPRQNSQDPIDEKVKSPIDKKVKDNTTSINTTRLITSTSSDGKSDLSDADKDLKIISEFFQKNIGQLVPNTIDDLIENYKTFGLEMIIHALTLTSDKSATYGYTKAIFKRWLKNNIKTMNDVKAEEVAFKNKTKSFTKRGSTHQEIIPSWVTDKENATSTIGNKTTSDTPSEEELKARLNALIGD